MASYLLKVYKVIPGAPRESYEAEAEPVYFKSEGAAYLYAEWWRGDQGREDTQVIETTVDCPVIEDVVFVPRYVL